MCGASTPFQFKTPRNDDLIEQELEDDDFLNITTNTLILEERIRKMEVEKEILNQVGYLSKYMCKNVNKKVNKSKITISHQ